MDGLATTLPAKLHRLLSSRDHRHLVAWMPHGRSWRIVDDAAFVEIAAARGYFNNISNRDDDDDEGEESEDVDSHRQSRNRNKSTATTAAASFHSELLKWGFRRYRKSDSPDVGSYYHSDFLRGREERVDNLNYAASESSSEAAKEGDGNVAMNEGAATATASIDNNNNVVEGKSSLSPSPSSQNNNIQQPPRNDDSSAVSDFLAFTGTSDPRAARTYLEMAGRDLETAVGLFVDHGMGGGAGGSLLSGSAAATTTMMGGGIGSTGTGVGTGEEDDNAAAAAATDDAANNDDEEEEEEPDFYVAAVALDTV